MLAKDFFFQDTIQNPLTRLRELNTRLDVDTMMYDDSEIYLAKAWNSSPIPMWIKDLSGKMVFLNDAYCSIYGINKSDYIGKTDDSIWGTESAKHFKLLDDKVLRGGEVEYSIEDVPSSGHVRQFDKCHVIKFPIRNGPKIVGIAGMITGVFP